MRILQGFLANYYGKSTSQNVFDLGCYWLPFNGANTGEKENELSEKTLNDQYTWRASYLPVLNFASQFVYDPTQNFDASRAGMNEWKRVAPFLLKDFYTLTPYHAVTDDTAFVSFAYFDSERREGVLFAFRQAGCKEDKFDISLSFLDGKFDLTDADDGKTITLPDGRLSLTLDTPRSAKLYFIRMN